MFYPGGGYPGLYFPDVGEVGVLDIIGHAVVLSLNDELKVESITPVRVVASLNPEHTVEAYE